MANLFEYIIIKLKNLQISKHNIHIGIKDNYCLVFKSLGFWGFGEIGRAHV